MQSPNITTQLAAVNTTTNTTTNTTATTVIVAASPAIPLYYAETVHEAPRGGVFAYCHQGQTVLYGENASRAAEYFSRTGSLPPDVTILPRVNAQVAGAQEGSSNSGCCTII